jgi:hypothetical protein
MSDPMALKWAIVDLIKVIDAAHEGRFHGDLQRIARTLGVELTPPVAVEVAIVGDVDLPFGKAKKAAKGVS